MGALVNWWTNSPTHQLTTAFFTRVDRLATRDASAVTVDSPERSSGRDIGVCLGALARVGSRGGGARSIFPRSPAGLRPIDRSTRPSWSACHRPPCVAAARRADARTRREGVAPKRAAGDLR